MTEDLLEHGAASHDRIDLWERILRGCGATRMAEVGVWRGTFAAAMLRSCPDLSLYLMIDPWRPLEGWNKPLNVDAASFEAARRAALAAVAFAGSKAVECRGTTAEVAGGIPDASLDAIYVDGDHTLRGITIDLVRMLPKIRPHGLLGGDDFDRNPWHHGPAHEPTMVNPFAVHFAEAMDLPIVLLPFRQYVILKSPGGFSVTDASGTPYRGRIEPPPPRWRCALERVWRPAR